MSTMRSITSTTRLVDFFAGVSRTDFMMPSDREPPTVILIDEASDQTRIMALSAGKSPGASRFITFHLQETTSGIDQQNAFRRAACHILIDMLSDRGLPELLDTITGLVEFYSKSIDQVQVPRLLTTRARGKMIGTRERPEFQVDE
jgi:hypothetical protein